MREGTCRETGSLIGGIPYLIQRIKDALETEIGSLVIERDYGSRLHEIVDMNIDLSFEMHCYVRVAECLANPKNGIDDFRLEEIQVNPLGEGNVELTLIGFLMNNGEPIKLEGIMIDGKRS